MVMLDVGRGEGQGVSKEFRGKTLRVYAFLLNVGEPVGVRQVQRRLGFSSPSLALYHLDKLVEMGLIERDPEGDYRVVKKVDVDAARMFIAVGMLRLPRFLFYTVFFLVTLVYYALTTPYYELFTRSNLFVYAIGIIALAIFVYETLRAIKYVPA